MGALFGALGGALGGGRQPDVAGFEARALRDESLGRGFSATGYVYYPAGTYGALEILLTASDGAVRTVTAPVTPAD